MLALEAQITASQVLHAFHRDEPFLILGAAFMTVALLCAAFSLLSRKLDALLLWLAAFAFLYGLRLWIDTQIVGFTLESLPLFGRIDWAINFLTPVPAFLFFQTAGLLPRRGKFFTAALTILFLGLAFTTLLAGRLSILHTINNVAVIAALPFVLVRTYLQGAVNRDFVIMRRGLLCFVLLALWDNTLGDYWLHRTRGTLWFCCIPWLPGLRCGTPRVATRSGIHRHTTGARTGAPHAARHSACLLSFLPFVSSGSKICAHDVGRRRLLRLPADR